MEVEPVIAEAFPSEKRRWLPAAEACLTVGPLPPVGCIHRSDREPLRVAGETLMIPHRQYDRPLDPASLEPHAKLVWLAWFTRSHDGRLRQAAIREFPRKPEPWLFPYLIQPLGEYVIEISHDVRQLIAGALEDPPKAHALGKFWIAYPSSAAITKSRARSYWDVYYRPQAPTYAEYPAAMALAELDRNGAETH